MPKIDESNDPSQANASGNVARDVEALRATVEEHFPGLWPAVDVPPTPTSTPEEPKQSDKGDPVSPRNDGPLLLTRLSDVEPKEVTWLWPSYIPIGKLTLLIGDPGLGKSFVSLDVAARVTTGRNWPDGAASIIVGDVILLQAEDDRADTIRPRFDALGGDAERLTLLEGARIGPGQERMVTLQQDIDNLRILFEDSDTRLLIIDPVTAYLGPNVDSHKDADVRRVLTPVAKLAATTGVAVLGVMHLNKREDFKALYRAGGSIAFAAVARIVLAVAKDPEDPNRRLLMPVKSNIAAVSTGLAFRVGNALTWEEGAVEVNPEELLGGAPPGPRPAPKRAVARELIVGMLASGPMPVAKVKAAGVAQGISEPTVERAAKGLSVQTVREARLGAWLWALPGSSSSGTPLPPEGGDDETPHHQAPHEDMGAQPTSDGLLSATPVDMAEATC